MNWLNTVPNKIMVFRNVIVCSVPGRRTIIQDLCDHKKWCLSLYTRLNIYTYMGTYIHTYIRTQIHTCIHTYIHTYIHTHIHTYVHRYIHGYIHTYIHTYTNTYIHTYIHIYFLNPKDLSNDSWIWNKFQKYNKEHNTQHKNSTNTQHRSSTNIISKRIIVKCKQENLKMLRILNICYKRNSYYTWEI